MIVGFLIVCAFWCCLFGLNVPIRAVVERYQTSGQEVLARFDLQQTPQPVLARRWKRVFLIFAVFLVLLSCLGETFDWQDLRTNVGLIAGSLFVLYAVWPLYQKSHAYRTETVVFDLQGMTIFLPRMSRVGDGVFHTRIEWKNCYGYSVMRGNLLLALRPFGHVEQSYGPYRAEMIEVLDRLGVRKLTLFDVLSPEEASEGDLLQAEQQVQALVHDLMLGYRHEVSQHGMHLDFEQMYNEDDPNAVERFAFLQLRLWEGEECVQQVDWLIWARYEELVELLTLPKERLYEMLDDKVQSMIEARLTERGVTPPPLLLQ